MTNADNTPSCAGCHLVGIWWWAALIVAVLAVPSIGFVVSLMVPSNEYSILPIFVITCWVSTYIGMKLMRGSPKK